MTFFWRELMRLELFIRYQGDLPSFLLLQETGFMVCKQAGGILEVEAVNHAFMAKLLLSSG